MVYGAAREMLCRSTASNNNKKEGFFVLLPEQEKVGRLGESEQPVAPKETSDHEITTTQNREQS